MLHFLWWFVWSPYDVHEQVIVELALTKEDLRQEVVKEALKEPSFGKKLNMKKIREIAQTRTQAVNNIASKLQQLGFKPKSFQW